MSSQNKKIALTFDVELWHEGKWLKPYVTKDLGENDTSFERSMDTILDLLKHTGNSATFFITDAVAHIFPHYVTRIAESGHEVASHGIDHTKLFETTYVDYAPRFKAHISELERLSGKKVRGFRAPHFSVTKESAWIFPLLAECGLTYDSSVFPLNMGAYGYSSAPKTAYSISGTDFLIPSPDGILREIPLSTTSCLGVRLPFAGGIYFRLLPLWLFRLFLSKEAATSTPPVLYFHPHELESTTPQIRRGPYLKRLLKYWGVSRSFRKFEKMLEWYIFDSIENIFLEK